MKKLWNDPAMRWILGLTAGILLCIGGMSLIDPYLPRAVDAQAITILDVPEASMRLYAQVQNETGIPWVLLCAVDRVEDFVPDLARVRTVADAFVRAGAIERGWTVFPITNAADLAGLYTKDRKAIAHISRQMLALEDLYLLIAGGRFPANGGIVADEADGCRITGATEVRSPFDGTVTRAKDGDVDIECDNGLTVSLSDIIATEVAPGERVKAGEALGLSDSFFLVFWYGNRWIHPYPYVILCSD